MKLLLAIYFLLFGLLCKAQSFTTPGGAVGTTSGGGTYTQANAGDMWQGTIRATSGANQYSSFALYEASTLKWALYNHFYLGGLLAIANTSGVDRLSLKQSGELGIDMYDPQTKLDVGAAHGNGLQFRYDRTASYRIRLTPYWNSATDTRLDFNVERSPGQGFATVMSVGYNDNVGIGTTSPLGRLHVSGGDVLLQNTGASGYPSLLAKSADGTNSLRLDYNSIIHSGGHFYLRSGGTSPLVLNDSDGGFVGIGTSSPDAKLSVKGQIHAQEVKVDLNGAVAPDYVFEKDYKLPSLEQIQSYITAHKHLPEVPSSKEMEDNGINLGEMNLLLLKKVEELTLYILDQEKRIQKLEQKDNQK